MSDRVPPHDLDAERAVLGACMLSLPVARQMTNALSPEDFYRPAHATVLSVFAALLREGEPVDPITVVARLRASGDLERCGGIEYVMGLPSAVPSAGSADWYARIVVDCATARQLIAAAGRVADLGYTAGEDAHEAAERAVAVVREVRDRTRDTGPESVAADLHDFLAVEESYDWLIPGLLERGDRLVLTAGEGSGKSTLIRQLAIATAAGLHPFTGKPIDPLRVLYLDCENSASMTRRKLAPLTGTAARLGRQVPRERMFVECRPEGVDFTRGADRSWLLRHIERVMPQLLVVGPVYRLHAGDPNSEELARKVSAVIDEARAIARCAVVMEAHSPHSTGFGQQRPLRPLGSSLWMRWPEFGYGLRPLTDPQAIDRHAHAFVPWRGARDERDWPQYVQYGATWPWVPYIPLPGGGPSGARDLAVKD
jgi:replicative DNA helicase